LPPLGGFLFSEASCPDLDTASLANEHLYAALRALCVVNDREERITRVTDFEHLGAEELGGIYESLLELGFKEWSMSAGLCELADAPGNERKLTGSYYTPTSLITSLLDTALDPIIEHALGSPDPEAALLALKICDPACGSGHFLVAAAHRLARRLAALRTDEREPAAGDVRHALREVATRCLYGVDVNPLSVELCKVSIWLEALEPGRPLAFLESHIQCGNSLLGCTPALLKQGLPDEAFKTLTGDDPAACRALAKDNRDARDAKQELFELTNRTALAAARKASGNLWADRGVDRIDIYADNQPVGQVVPTQAGLMREQERFAERQGALRLWTHYQGFKGYQRIFGGSHRLNEYSPKRARVETARSTNNGLQWLCQL
jgi:hypothetical protein